MRNPNGYGSIVKLSGKRRKPFMVRAAAKEVYHADTGKVTVERPVIGCFATRKEALEELAKYNVNPYDIDMRKTTFAELYNMYYEAKYINSTKTFSESSMRSTAAAFKNCASIHNMVFADLRKIHLQKDLDECPLKHSSLELIKNLFRQMYRFALENDFVDKDYSEFVTINIPDDDEKGYFQGGVKTKSGKNRIVPIHPGIYGMVAAYHGKTWLETSVNDYRTKVFYPTLERLGLLYASNGTKHTPHDCRHTFSWLCDRYKIDDMSKHLLMGHALGSDVEKNVYGHRTFDELKHEIEKICIPKH